MTLVIMMITVIHGEKSHFIVSNDNKHTNQ